jgi:hypothetical protein
MESLTVDHSEYNVLRVSLTLHSEDILSRFQKRVTHCCCYKVTILGTYPIQTGEPEENQRPVASH